MLEMLPLSDWEQQDWRDAIEGRKAGYKDGRTDGYVSEWNIFTDFEMEELLFYGANWDISAEQKGGAYWLAYQFGYDEGFYDGFYESETEVKWG